MVVDPQKAVKNGQETAAPHVRSKSSTEVSSQCPREVMAAQFTSLQPSAGPSFRRASALCLQ